MASRSSSTSSLAGQAGRSELYAGAGFAATFLTNKERQQIFENDMLPYLSGDDWDGAILAAMDRVDEAATLENASPLHSDSN